MDLRTYLAWTLTGLYENVRILNESDIYLEVHSLSQAFLGFDQPAVQRYGGVCAAWLSCCRLRELAVMKTAVLATQSPSSRSFT